MSLFTPQSGKAEPINLIPSGTLAFVNVNVKISNSKERGGYLYNLELTVLNGKYKGRKLFDLLACPFDKRNHNPLKDNPKKWVEMAITNITRLLETADIFKPSEPDTYLMFNNLLPSDREPTLVEISVAAKKLGHEIDGTTAAISIKIEPGRDGYQDKNKVGEWLSSNPISGGYKKYLELKEEFLRTGEVTRGAAFSNSPEISNPQSARTSLGGSQIEGPTWLKEAQN